MANDTTILDDCIQMLRECTQKCDGWKNQAASPAAKVVLTCCAFVLRRDGEVVPGSTGKI